MNARTKERMSFSRCGTLATSAGGRSELWASESTAARHRCGVVRVAREAPPGLRPCSERRTVHPRQSPTPVPQAALGHAEAQGRRAGSEEARERPWSEQQDGDGDERDCRTTPRLAGGKSADSEISSSNSRSLRIDEQRGRRVCFLLCHPQWRGSRLKQ